SMTTPSQSNRAPRPAERQGLPTVLTRRAAASVEVPHCRCLDRQPGAVTIEEALETLDVLRAWRQSVADSVTDQLVEIICETHRAVLPQRVSRQQGHTPGTAFAGTYRDTDRRIGRGGHDQLPDLGRLEKSALPAQFLE